ncbi:MAG: ATPase [Proteobacteria bacterium]|nr:ATPase [Pseudomonadota bacterium]
MPQISQLAATYASQIFWLLLTFGIVFVVIGLGMVPKIQGTVDQRDRTVADDLVAAEGARKAADQAEEEWRTRENAIRAEAQKVLAEARATAARATEKTLGEANDRIAQRLTSEESRIAEAGRAAMSEIEAVAADAAQTIVARLSGANVSDDEARNAVKAVLVNG